MQKPKCATFEAKAKVMGPAHHFRAVSEWLWSALTASWRRRGSGKLGEVVLWVAQPSARRKWCFHAGPLALLSHGEPGFDLRTGIGRGLYRHRFGHATLELIPLAINCLMATDSHPVFCYHPSAPEPWMEKQAAPPYNKGLKTREKWGLLKAIT